MVYTNAWDETAPLGSAMASTVDNIIRQLKLDLRERLALSSAAFDSGFTNFDPIVDVASYATGGAGTVGDPWTGWDTAISWSTASKFLFRHNNYFQAAGDFTISAAGSIVFAYGATITFPTDDDAEQGVRISASNVRWYGGTITGPDHSDATYEYCGFRAYGASAASYISGLHIEGVTVSNFCYAGILTEFVSDFTIIRNYVYDIYSHGITTLSSSRGHITGNRVYCIGETATDAEGTYGIACSQHTGALATYPTSTDMVVANNYIRDVRHHDGICFHPVHRGTIANNVIYDCKNAIDIAPSYEVGSETAAEDVTVVGNSCTINRGVGSVVGAVAVSATRLSVGCFVVGYWLNGGADVPATRVTVTGNTFEGFGTAYSTNEYGVVSIQRVTDVVVADNVIVGATGAAHGISLYSAERIRISNNEVSGFDSDASVAASGTITFADNPTPGDTITLNGQPFTFVAGAPANTYQIQVGADLATTLGTLETALNAHTSGRISVCTYSADATTLTITHDTLGTAGHNFTLAASADTVSHDHLENGTVKTCGLWGQQLSASSIDITGIVDGNTFHNGTHVGISIYDSNPSLHFRNNVFTGTGPWFDCRSSQYSAYPQDGVGAIDRIGVVAADCDLPSIGATTYATLCLACPGMDAYRGTVRVSYSTVFDPIILTSYGNYGWLAIRAYNPTAAPVDIGSVRFRVEYGQTESLTVGTFSN